MLGFRCTGTILAIGLCLTGELGLATPARAASPDCHAFQPQVFAQKQGGYPQAISLLERAARNHDGCAEIALGLIYMSGVGDNRLYRNPPRALALWRAAEKDGITGARIWIAQVDEHGYDWMMPPPFKEVGQSALNTAGAEPPSATSQNMASGANTRALQPPNTIVGAMQQLSLGIIGGNSDSNGGFGSPLEMGAGMNCAQQVMGSSLSADDQAKAIANCKRRTLRALKPLLDDAQKRRDERATCLRDDNCPDNE